MLGQRLLDNARISISEDAQSQYVVVQEEVQKLCNLTHMGWHLTGADLFNAVRKVSFAEGIVCGVALTGAVLMVRKFRKLKNTLSEE